MFLIIAAGNDLGAKSFVRVCSEYGTLMTPSDLSREGWEYRPGAAHLSTLAVGDRLVSAREISVVVSRLACVPENELVGIVPEDRPYVAAEMTAFLQAWLSELQVPVVNRPTPTCLSGPYWRREKWVHVAGQLGIRARPTTRKVTLTSAVYGNDDLPNTETVTVVGNRCIGEVHPTLATAACNLARTAGTELLAVEFDGTDAGASFLGAHLWPDLSSSAVADALLTYLQNSSPSSPQLLNEQ